MTAFGDFRSAEEHRPLNQIGPEQDGWFDFWELQLQAALRDL